MVGFAQPGEWSRKRRRISILDVEGIFGAMVALMVLWLQLEVCCVSFMPQESSRSLL